LSLPPSAGDVVAMSSTLNVGVDAAIIVVIKQSATTLLAPVAAADWVVHGSRTTVATGV